MYYTVPLKRDTTTIISDRKIYIMDNHFSIHET